MLSLYRAALALRHAHPGLAGGAFRWIAAPDGVLAFERDAGFACLVNISRRAVPLPRSARVILRSDTGMAAPTRSRPMPPPGSPCAVLARTMSGPPAIAEPRCGVPSAAGPGGR